MIKKKKPFFQNPFVQLFFFILLLLVSRTIWYLHYAPPEHPQAVSGTLDMRGWDFEHSRIVPLNGEWLFYPGQFVTRANLLEGGGVPSRYIQAPGDWREALDSQNDASYGFGTYRLQILVDGTATQPYGFKFDNIQTASRVEINGEELAHLGVLSDRPQDYKPNVHSYTVSYPANGDHVIDLLVQVANFDNPSSGGITSSVKFGSQAKIDGERSLSINLQLVTFVIFLFHAVYALIMFAINPRQKILLIAFLLFICAGFTIVTVSDRILLQWLPLTYSARTKIGLLSYVYLTFCILAMTLKLVGGSWKSLLFRLYAIVLGLYMLFLIGASVQAVYNWYSIFSFLYIVPFAAVLVLFVKKVRQNSHDILLLMAATSVIFSVFGGVLQRYLTTEFYPLDMLAALVTFSTYWFKNYFRNAEDNVKLNERLIRNDKLKDEFLAHTAHELRTPLHGMISLAQTVINEERQTIRPQNNANMELLLRIGQRMSQLINDLLDISRLQNKRIVLMQERVTLQSIVPGVFSLLGYFAEAKGLRLKMDVPDTFPSIYADEKRLVQILYNLLHNAIKFTDTGSIIISAEANERMASIHVADTGSGMDDETRERIFQAYEQGVHGMGGIGLGLSICKQLTELHGGLLSVHSKPDQGSVFTFTIPLASPDSMALLETAAAWKGIEPNEGLTTSGLPLATSSRGSDSDWHLPEEALPPESEVPKILIVDDDPMNLKVLTSLFQAEQYFIVPALSGKEALAKLETSPVDLAIIDVMMPHMSGYELTREIRKQFTVSELPILLLTARSQPEDIYTGFSSGANDYVTKPIDALELKYRISALVSLKQSINERLRMEAAYLQAQIHPHFLFNTLNSLLALSNIDTERMRNLGQAFTSYLRISFDYLNSGKLVSLPHELELVQSYLYIEKERFEDRLSVVWEVEPDISLHLPPLSIQPLVENAVRHGLLSRNLGGTVHLRIARQDGFTLIEVEDNGMGMEQKQVMQLLNPIRKANGGIGISNTNLRLIELYGQGLSIISNPGKGTTVSFVIPDN
jgi:sensor histidine kinase YesM